MDGREGQLARLAGGHFGTLFARSLARWLARAKLLMKRQIGGRSLFPICLLFASKRTKILVQSQADERADERTSGREIAKLIEID